MLQNDKSIRALAWISDLALLVCLVTEIIFAHSIVSQTSMLLFFLCTALMMLQRKRLYFSWWMIVYAVFILWSAVVSFRWALDRDVSMDMVKTMVVTTGFFVALFQYLMLRADLRRYLAVYVIAIFIVVCYLYYNERMLPWSVTRLGAADGVHPNIVGHTSAVAFGACVMLIDRKWRLLWIIPMAVILGAIILTISFGSLVIACGLAVVLVLVRFPKKWGIKLAALAAVGLIAGSLVLFTELFSGISALAHVREVGLYLLKGEGVGGSSAERLSLFMAAYRWFLQRPMTGWGLACFRFLEGSLGTYSHNNYIELLVSGGIPLLIIYYTGQIGALVYAARAVRRSKAEDTANEHAEARRMVYVFLVMLASHFVMDIGGVSFYERHYSVYLVLLIASARLLRAKSISQATGQDRVSGEKTDHSEHDHFGKTDTEEVS